MSSTDPGLDAALDEALRLARLGDSAATKAHIEQVRQRHDVHGCPQAALRLMLAEGVMLAYGGDLAGARDRMRRALVLCVPGTASRHEAMAHAWMAFLDYGDARYGDVVHHAFEAIRLGQGTSRPACARAASLIGMLHTVCGDGETAARWFAQARRLAAADGDGAMTSAIIFNMAASRFAAARVRQVGEGQAGAIDQADLLFLQSSRNYDDGRRLAVQGFLHRMLQGFALAATGEHRRALESLALFDTDEVPPPWRGDAVIVAEQAWCRLQCGELAQARAGAERAEAALDGVTETGERVIVHERLREVAQALDDSERAARHAALRDEALAAHRVFQDGLRQQLATPPAMPDTLLGG